MKLSRQLWIFTSLVAGLVLSGNALSQTRQAQTPTQNTVTITTNSTQEATSSGGTFTLKFPAGTLIQSIKTLLNGQDVRTRFAGSDCSNGVCVSAVLTGADGVRDGKNVLYATAKNQNGTSSSSRLRFEGKQTAAIPNSLRVPSLARPVAQFQAAGLPTLSTFLPPTVAFNTIYVGGANAGSNWFQIGSQEPLAIGNCQGPYAIVILDRQTLQEKTAAPEHSPACASSDGDLSTYLKGLAQATPKLDDLVIIGTMAGQYTDAGTGNGVFSTYWIGGRTYNCGNNCTPADGGNTTTDVPAQYMAIGVLGAESGSAYENYTTSTNKTADAYATGMLVEDAEGDYNFQSSGNVEYAVQPGQNAAQAYIKLNNPPSIVGGANSQHQDVVIWPPSSANGASGFWVVVLDRNNLSTLTASPSACSPEDVNTPSSSYFILTNCGTFIATSGANGAPGNITQLTALLQSVTSSQLAIVTTIGTAGWGSANVIADNFLTTPSNPNDAPFLTYADNGVNELGDALQTFGIPDKLILETGAANSTFTMVGSPGLGGPLSGHNVFSSSYLAQQGETGYVHGTFAKDNRGLFEPSHTQQEPGLNISTNTATDNANLQLGVVMSQQPVEWPEFAAPLNGSSTLAGQADAYSYLSWYLLNTWYFIGQVGQSGVPTPQAYDIHYFFTGSLNTWIDIHTFDPLNAQFPSNSNGCGSTCTWQGPDGTQFNFTAADFAAVQAQLHNEIADLTNVLSYFVTGSTNFKDIVASGNSNTALALLQAFATVQGNITAQGINIAPATKVKVSPWHIVSMIASDAAPFISQASGGAISAGTIKDADHAIGIIADLISYSGGVNGGLSTTNPAGTQTGTADIPRLDYSLDTNVGSFAGLALQDQFLAGFDSTLDSITSDWNKLNLLGSSVFANQVLYSPTQAAQNLAISQITMAEEKSLYLSLIPAVFQLHFWNMTSGVSTLPDMGYTKNGATNSCSTFYPGIVAPPSGFSAPGVFLSYPTYGGTQYPQDFSGGGGPGQPFQYSEAGPFQDWFVLSLPFLNTGHSNTNAQVMNLALGNLLFGNGSGDVNFSLDEFVTKSGPMDLPFTGGPSTWINFSYDPGPIDFLAQPPQFGVIANGITPGEICSASELNTNAPSVSPRPSPPGTTNTTLQVPSNAVLGDNITLQASVALQATSTPAAGNVQFRDGSTVLYTATLDPTGSASYTTNALSLGPHSLSASFASGNGSMTPSDSAPQTLTVYANSPDMTLSLSQTSLNVSYGGSSPATTLQVQPLSGLSGTVKYSCSGLPVGMQCTFTPASGTLSAGSAVTTTFTISGGPLLTSSMGETDGFKAILLSISIMLTLNLRSKQRWGRQKFSLLLLVLVIGGIVGCSGHPTTSSTVQEAGSKTVLITATCGSLTKTVPLDVIVN